MRQRLPGASGRASCSVCGRDKPHWVSAAQLLLDVLAEGETASAEDQWWRECPDCHVSYCRDHKGLLWTSTESWAVRRCLACGYKW